MERYTSRINYQRFEFIDQIRRFFKVNNLETIYFNHAFTVWLSDDSGDGSYIKNPHIVKSFEDGNILLGEDHEGNEFEVNIELLEDIVEVAYILDTLIDREFVEV